MSSISAIASTPWIQVERSSLKEASFLQRVSAFLGSNPLLQALPGFTSLSLADRQVRMVELVESPYFSSSYPEVKKLVSSLPNEHQKNLFKNLVYRLLEKQEIKLGSSSLLERCLNLIDLSTLEAWLKEEGMDIASMQEVLSHQEAASSKTIHYSIFETWKDSILNALATIVDTYVTSLLTIWGFFNPGIRQMQRWEASHLLRDIADLFFSMPTLFYGAAVSVAEFCGVISISTPVGIILAVLGLVLYIASIYLYWNYLQPVPKVMPHCKNLTENYRTGKSAPLPEVRSQEIEAIIQALNISGNKEKVLRAYPPSYWTFRCWKNRDHSTTCSKNSLGSGTCLSSRKATIYD